MSRNKFENCCKIHRLKADGINCLLSELGEWTHRLDLFSASQLFTDKYLWLLFLRANKYLCWMTKNGWGILKDECRAITILWLPGTNSRALRLRSGFEQTYSSFELHGKFGIYIKRLSKNIAEVILIENPVQSMLLRFPSTTTQLVYGFSELIIKMYSLRLERINFHNERNRTGKGNGGTIIEHLN